MMRLPRSHEREEILAYTMQKDLANKSRCIKASVVLVSLFLICILKYSNADGKVEETPEVMDKDRQELLQKLKASYVIKAEDVKNKLVDILNASDVSVENRDYRILYYLYYVSFLDDGMGDNFLNTLTDEGSLNSHISFGDLFYFYVTDKFKYGNILKTPKEDAMKITYENIDIFLELSMLLNMEVLEGNIEKDIYLEYIQSMGEALRERDTDLYRVWSYHINNNSMISKLLNLKILVYNKNLELNF